MKRILILCLCLLACVAQADIGYHDPVKLISTNGIGWWEIDWTQLVPTGFTFRVNTTIVDTSASNQFIIVHYTNDPAAYDYTVYYDGTNTSWNSTNSLTLTFPSGTGSYDIVISNTFGGLANGGPGIDEDKIIEIKAWGNQAQWVSGYQSFLTAANLKIYATDVPDLSGVKSCYQMFRNADGLNWTNIVVSNWNVSAVVDFREMWRGFDVAEPTYPVFHGFETWDLDSADSVFGMFYFAKAQKDWCMLCSWDVSNIKNFGQLFYRNTAVTSFNFNVWNVGSATNFRGMFDSLTLTEINIPWSNLTASVEDMREMFSISTLLTNVNGCDGWTITNVRYMASMFGGVTLNSNVYSSILTGWEAQAEMTNVVFSGGNSKYLAGASATARSNLVNSGWTITDGGLGP